MVKLKFRSIFWILLIFFSINHVFSYSLLGPHETFTVIPEKKYSGEICIGAFGDRDLFNRTFLYSFESNDTVFVNFTMDKEVTSDKRDKFCNSYYFFGGEYTSSVSKSPAAAILVSEKVDSGIVMGYKRIIYADTSSVTYRHALINLSKNFIFVFVSIFSVFGLILYILKKNKFNE